MPKLFFFTLMHPLAYLIKYYQTLQTLLVHMTSYDPEEKRDNTRKIKTPTSTLDNVAELFMFTFKLFVLGLQSFKHFS